MCLNGVFQTQDELMCSIKAQCKSNEGILTLSNAELLL